MPIWVVYLPPKFRDRAPYNPRLANAIKYISADFTESCRIQSQSLPASAGPRFSPTLRAATSCAAPHHPGGRSLQPNLRQGAPRRRRKYKQSQLIIPRTEPQNPPPRPPAPRKSNPKKKFARLPKETGDNPKPRPQAATPRPWGMSNQYCGRGVSLPRGGSAGFSTFG